MEPTPWRVNRNPPEDDATWIQYPRLACGRLDSFIRPEGQPSLLSRGWREGSAPLLVMSLFGAFLRFEQAILDTALANKIA
jgi:hypothetical protein